MVFLLGFGEPGYQEIRWACVGLERQRAKRTGWAGAPAWLPPIGGARRPAKVGPFVGVAATLVELGQSFLPGFGDLRQR